MAVVGTVAGVSCAPAGGSCTAAGGSCTAAAGTDSELPFAGMLHCSAAAAETVQQPKTGQGTGYELESARSRHKNRTKASAVAGKQIAVNPWRSAVRGVIPQAQGLVKHASPSTTQGMGFRAMRGMSEEGSKPSCSAGEAAPTPGAAACDVPAQSCNRQGSLCQQVQKGFCGAHHATVLPYQVCQATGYWAMAESQQCL